MQERMDRFADFLRRRRWAVLLIWVGLLAAAVPFMLRQTDHLTNGGTHNPPGSSSYAVQQALQEFPGSGEGQLVAVVERGSGATTSDVDAAVERIGRAAARIDHVALTAAAADRAREQAADGSAVLIVPMDVSGTLDQSADAVVELRQDLGIGSGDPGPVTVSLTGKQAMWAAMTDLSKENLASAEAIGLPIILLVLLAVFGSFAAATLPLALGAGSVVMSGAAVYFLSQSMNMSVFVTDIASMLGLGVAVDYSLFVLTRYQEEIRAGRSPDEARRVALRTSGLAVVFSGATVVVSLCGLFLTDLTIFQSMAVGAITVVALSVLGAVVLLPVLIQLLGRHAYTPGRIRGLTGLLGGAFRRLRPRRPGIARPGLWERWVGTVTRRSALFAALAAGLMILMAVPALSLRLGDGTLRQFPEGNEARRAAEQVAAVAGPGAAGPVQIMATFTNGPADTADHQQAVTRAVEALGADPEVAAVAEPVTSADGRRVLITAQPRHDYESTQTESLVERLRGQTGDWALSKSATVDIGGATAGLLDYRDRLAGAMWKVLAFVLVSGFLLLVVLLRSVLIPLKAVVLNLLSVAAGYGALVVVFQWGWLDGLFGFDSLGYVNVLTPPLLLAIVFGLSMDYEVFMLSRIREHYAGGDDIRTAVTQGLRRSARTISSAALIMVAVFSVFIATAVPTVKEMGVGLAVAVALDATLVRLVLVPATMQMLGRANWWLPAWLDRFLPRTDFEAAEPVEPPAPATVPAEQPA